MWAEIQETGRVFLRRDLGKYRFIPSPQGIKIIYDKRPSDFERDTMSRLTEIVRAFFRKEAA